MTRWFAFLTLLLAGTPAAAQEPYIPENAPVDQPKDINASQAAKLDSAIAPYVAKARETFPNARDKFLAGLPEKYSFFVTTRVTDPNGKYEQIFVFVDSIRGEFVHGRIWSHLGLVKTYSRGQQLVIGEDELLDWVIVRPDGTEDGNFVGKFLDTYSP